MHARRCLWLGVLLLGSGLAGCSGGRGSSGFDINAENTAIGRALSTQQCVEFGGLTICPANQSSTPTGSASPTPTPSSTPGNPTPVGVTPTMAQPATPTKTPQRAPGVDTTLGNGASIDCIQHEPGGPCTFTLTFVPQGLPPNVTFRVATRPISPDGSWRLGPDPVASGSPQAPSFDVPLILTSTQSGPPGHVQFAVLAFSGLLHPLPSEFQELRITNAAFAFVTAVVAVNVVAAYPPLGAAPQISYFGLTRADEVVLIPTEVDAQGRPIYVRSSGDGIFLVVEARPGTTGVAVGTQAFSASGGLPDLQMLVGRPLGNGSAAVCDKVSPNDGGVPGTDPLVFSDTPPVVDAINDLGCRVDDGAGSPIGRGGADACTIPNAASAEFGFVNPASAIQFCLTIARAWAFPAGDTTVAARVRDLNGDVSAPQEIVIRVLSSSPVPTRTMKPSLGRTVTSTARPESPTPTSTIGPSMTVTSTQTPTPEGPPLTSEAGPRITYLGITRADGVPIASVATDANGRLVYPHVIGSGIFLVVEAQPGVMQRPIGSRAYDPAGGLPDLQILVSRPLGNGSALVCDMMAPTLGGVPATDPPVFSNLPAEVAAINDLGCRVDLVGRTAADACTVPNPSSAAYAFVDAATTLQYCLPIVPAWEFPAGDTVVVARVRDVDGTVGMPREIVVRVGPLTPTPTSTKHPPVTPSATRTRVPSPMGGPSATFTGTPSPTRTPTPVPEGAGPVITYLGITRSDGVPIPPASTDGQGRPVYTRAGRFGMILVVEARPGLDELPVGRSSFDASGGLPDLQLLVSRPLGDGNPAVCDMTRPHIGGVPATDPLTFADERAVVDAINDLGCRVDNGAGEPSGRSGAIDACTIPNARNGEFGFIDARTTLQYCLPIAGAWQFSMGDTIIAARLRDTSGTFGLPAEIVVRVGAAP